MPPSSQVDDQPQLMNAAGTVKSLAEARAVLRSAASAVVLGSFTVKARTGNVGTTYFEGDSGSLNSLGLPNPGILAASAIVGQVKSEAADQGKPVWVSVAGFSPDEYADLAEAALTAGADVVELNLSCPNIWHEGDQKPIFSYSVELAAAAIDSVASRVGGAGSLAVKLSPILDMPLLDSIDRVLAEARIPRVVAVNTVPNCFGFDSAGEPAIQTSTNLGGLGGPAVKWIGMGQLSMHRSRLPDAALIGVGGIRTGQDLAEYLSDQVGASACQIATEFFRQGPRAFESILSEYVDIIAAL